MYSLRGHTALNAFQAIIRRHPQVSHISLVEHVTPPFLQDRLVLSDEDAAVVQQALELRLELGLPFWDAIMVSCERHATGSEELFQAAVLHQDLRGREVWLERESLLSAQGLAELSSAFTPGLQLAVTSVVRDIGGQEWHVPLLDFHCRQSDQHVVLASHVASILLPDGWMLLSSDRSYHLYGIGLRNAVELREFLARALLFAPIVDRAYIAHQLLECRCVARLSAAQGKYEIPRVVAASPGVEDVP